MLLLRRLTGMMAAICTNVEVIFLGIMTFLVFSQVVTRYLFSYSLAWVEALARYLMIWMAFLGAASLFKDDSHIRMDLVYNKVPQGVRTFLGLLFGLLQIAFLVMLFKLGLEYAESVSIVISPTLRISMRWPAMIISISSVVMIFFILSHMVRTVIGLTGRTLTDD
jgi:TRAP-type C4-dicarboxylate transport system permease small subunit